MKIIKLRRKEQGNMTDRDKWPVPDNIKGASPRDAFLWFVCNAWPKFFGDGEVKTIIDHDFGLHVFRLGDWQLELKNLSEFPDDK